MRLLRSFRIHAPIRALALAVLGAQAVCGQVVETTGMVRVEAESFTAQTARTVNGVVYTWTVLAETPGFSGSGYIEAVPADDASTATVTTGWTSGSPQVDYSITFSNPGTYYVWVRGYAGDASTAGIYVGLNGTSPSNARIDLQQFNAWAWANTAAGSSTPVSVTIPAAGTYTLNFWMRDSGLDIDRILLTRNPNFSPAPDPNFWRNQSVYQIITDRFFDGDPSNNNFWGAADPAVGNKTHGGDLRGVEQKLEYIKSLGATAIWISPFLRNGKGDFDYHGYAATDFYKVDPRFGSLEDLQRLVREAQKRGILVIADVVVNHASTWVDSADSGWAAFRYPPNGYNLRYNSGGQQYAWPFDNASISSAFGNTNLANIFNNNGGTQDWGDATQVELGELASLDDFRTTAPYVRQRMKEIWSYWIDTVGFDAYRIDTVKHVEMGFWNEWSPHIRAAAAAVDRPNFFQFGEVYDGSDSKVGSYTGTRSGGNYKMESVLDYPLFYQVGSVFATASGATGAIETRYANLNTNSYDATSLNSLVLNLDNHDNPRFLNTSGSTPARLELALAFIYTTRGIPSLYYGTEQDFDGGGDPWNREDMFDGQFEGGPSNGDNFNMTHPRFKLVSKLNNLRRLYPALRTGTHHMLWVNWGGPGLLAYARRLGNEEAYVVMNTATSAQTIGARPTIHPAGTVLVDVLNPANTLTVTSGTDGIPTFTMPATSSRIYVAQSQVRRLSPVVESISPAHDAASISPASAITVTFSREMNTATVQTAFSTVPASTGTFTWSAGNTVMTYTPSSNLSGNTLYTVRIDGSATDSNGLAMPGAFESRFTTGAASATARPSINSFSGAGTSDTTATLNTAVTPNGAATTVFFEYGTTTNYGTSTAGQSIGSGNSPVEVTSNLTGLTAGATYQYRVYATNSVGTTTGANGSFQTSSPLPQVTTTEASFVTTGSASINATVNPNGLPTSVHFLWGTQADNLSNQTATQNVGSGTTNLGVWAELSGLAPDTTYFFKTVAVSGTASVSGAVLSFRTLPVKPTVTTLSTTNVTVTNALLPGVVNPNGSETVYFFEYGTNSTYGTTTASASAGSGTTAVAVSTSISNLAAGQTYFYRAVASNSFGLTYGSEQSFSAGLPPPSATTLAPASLTTSAATLRGSVNPNNSFASAWFEWGTTTNYASSSRITAADNMEGLTVFNLSSSVASGTGFGSYSRYGNFGTGAGTFLANASSNQTIDGAKSIGAYAGTAAGVSFRRPISTTRQFGSMLVSARFNVDNTKGFTGFNLKSANGSGSSGFGVGELVSFGVAPAGGNSGILVTDAAGQRVLDLGADVRNTIIDFKVDFDARNRRYVVGAKFRTNTSFTKLSGTMSGTGTNVTHLGFANWNSTGAFQDLMVDSLQVLGSTALGGGTNNISVSNSLSSLAANTLYHYRVAAMNLDGGISYGANSTFYTGIDLAVSATNTNSSLVQGGTGQFAITVSNVGASTGTTATVTVSNQLPAGMTMTSMTGSGWTINSNNLTATRSGSLNVGTNYPPITIGFAVSLSAPSSLTNQVTVSGGGDGNALNNTSNLTWSVAAGADLIVSKSTNSAFRQGSNGSFLVHVANVGGSPSVGAVTVTEQPPLGMTIVSMTGDGWSFNSTNSTASRSDALNADTNYPPIAVTVSLSSNAAAVLTNAVTVSGGGDMNAGNNAAQSVANVISALAPLEAWRQLNFGTTNNTGAAADSYVATEDGLPNLHKYAFGLNPTNTAAYSERPQIAGFPPFSITFRRARDASDVTMAVEATDNLSGNWTNIWSTATNAYGGGTNDFETLTIQDPVPHESVTNGRFLRINVIRP